jgi:hypothetical protein
MSATDGRSGDVLAPETISYGFLCRLMAQQREHPMPDPKADPTGHRAWLHVENRIGQIPRLKDLKRYANSRLKSKLTAEAMDRIREDVAATLGLDFSDVDLLSVRDVVEALYVAKAEPVTPIICSQAAVVSITDLQERGFERLTVGQMMDEWNMSRDPLEEMAKRAVEDNKIHDDYKIVTPRKQRQLWARRRP